MRCEREIDSGEGMVREIESGEGEVCVREREKVKERKWVGGCVCVYFFRTKSDLKSSLNSTRI